MATRLTAPALLALTALLGARPARAQVEASAGSPARGVLIPGAAVAGEADATSLEINPGQLGLVDSASSALVFDQWSDDIPREGRGLAFMLASPLIVRGISAGIGFQWLRPTLPGEPESYYQLQLGAGFRLGRGLGVGASWEHLFQSRYGGFDTFSLGLGVRLHAMAAVGLVVRDVGRPRPQPAAARVPREWEAEVAFRPTGTSALELAVGFRSLEGEGARDFLPRARLNATVARGLALFAEVDTPRRRTLLVDATGDRREATDYLGLVGLTASFDRMALSGAAVGDWRRDEDGPDGARGPGASLVLRSYTTRRPPLVALRSVARVKLAGLENDRSFLETVVRLRRLGDDPAVGAVLVEIGGLDLGYGRLEELRAVLEGLGRRKPVFGWLTQASTGEYYLASACHRLAMHPAGGLFLGGLAQTVTFYKSALDSLGVSVDLVRIAQWKGAMEPFVMKEQSEPVRENRNAVLDDVFSHLIAGIARGRDERGLQPAGVRALVDKGLFTPVEAKARGLVDEVADERELDGFVRRTLGRGWAVRDADFGAREPVRWRAPRVAVVLVDGAIAEGRPTGFPSIQGTVAWESQLLDALTAVRADPAVRALVLRVNSPGGSAFASDRIARAVTLVRRAGKPVVVSMGDTAASGGYYVAAPADVIFAPPSVITGSIGIFSFKVDAAGLAGKLGIAAETTKRGARADLFSPFRPWTDDERTAVMGGMEYFYRQFLQTVATGRKSRGISEARADELGRGRIWTGAQALGVGLVDRMGGVDAALEEAARLGRVPVGAGGLPELQVLPEPASDPLETLLALRRLASASERAPATDDLLAAFIARHGRAAARLVLPLLLGPAGGIQARMPYEIELR
jgi:protease-4